MKKVLICAIVVMSFFTIACQGGGGGGGGGGNSGGNYSDGSFGSGGVSVVGGTAPQGEYSVSTAPPLTTTQTIDRDGNINNPLDDYIHIYRDADGLAFQYRDVANRELLGDGQTLRTVRFSTGTGSTPNAFVNSGDYLKATTVTTNTASNPVRGVEGTLVTTDTLELGGKRLGLSFADFGIWKTRSEFTGTRGGQPTTSVTMNDPDAWKNGQRGQVAYFAAGGSGNAVFTGNALGVVRAYSGGAGLEDVAAGSFHELYGTASMNVNLAARSAALDINFNDFYNFRFNNLSVAERDGEVEDDRATLTIRENNNMTGIHFAGTRIDFDVDGQLYGPARTNPAEVVGEVELRQNQGAVRVEADIAFGAKR